MFSFFSEAYKKGLKRQVILKGLDLVIDALIDFKQTYQNQSNPQNQHHTPEKNTTNHL